MLFQIKGLFFVVLRIVQSPIKKDQWANLACHLTDEGFLNWKYSTGREAW